MIRVELTRRFGPSQAELGHYTTGKIRRQRWCTIGSDSHFRRFLLLGIFGSMNRKDGWVTGLSNRRLIRLLLSIDTLSEGFPHLFKVIIGHRLHFIHAQS
mmetsp:Transcript_6652/g.16360  ORF Transcript_6652/g.16360 Transcript_6652/m.16360 type:complete len:100 (-) Transcript_6652:89-388(-)